jgi:putative phosphoribosyl transferase
MRSFQSRSVAGRSLAFALSHHTNTNVVVLALGPGGVYVATQLATALGARLDVLIVRDIVVNQSAVGVLTEGGIPTLDPDVDPFALRDLQSAIAKEIGAIERTRVLYRGNQPFPNLTGMNVILVDDLVESASAMLAAAQLVRKKGASQVIVATPIATQSALEALTSSGADETVCLSIAKDVHSAYAVAESTRDSDVLLHLQRARASRAHS